MTPLLAVPVTAAVNVTAPVAEPVTVTAAAALVAVPNEPLAVELAPEPKLPVAFTSIWAPIVPVACRSAVPAEVVKKFKLPSNRLRPWNDVDCEIRSIAASDELTCN